MARVSTIQDAPSQSSQALTTADDLIVSYAPVARSMAARYRNRGIDLDDLEQVALLGLTKAARRFDPDAGFEFMSFATPTIRGELRRHFRDYGWVVRPPRRVQEMQAQISRAEEELMARLGRSPRPSELAAYLDAPLDDVIEALTAEGCFTPTSLDRPVADGAIALSDVLAAADHDKSRIEAALVLRPLIAGLSARDRQILRLRFEEDRTQDQIAHEVGLTQAQVSRILTKILNQLRQQLGEATRAA